MLKKSLVVIFNLFYQKNKIWTAGVQNSVQIVFEPPQKTAVWPQNQQKR